METFRVFANPAKGAERFIEMEVAMHDEGFPLSLLELDAPGKRTLAKYANGMSLVRFSGTMTASWKSPEDREACMRNQIARRRWKKVLKYARWLKEGRRPPHGPTYLHPSITGRQDSLLVPIDGTRRLMSYLEAGMSDIPVVILVATEVR